MSEKGYKQDSKAIKIMLHRTIFVPMAELIIAVLGSVRSILNQRRLRLVSSPT